MFCCINMSSFGNCCCSYGQKGLVYETNYRPVPIIDQFVRNVKDVSYIVQPLIYGYVCDRIHFLTRGVG